jgi:hypothetical protein
MSQIGIKTKIAVASLTGIGAYFLYNQYQKNNQNIIQSMSDEEIKNKITDIVKNYGKDGQKYKGIYLYSNNTGKVYLRSDDGNIYRAGNLSDCPFLTSPDNKVTSYEITDIYNSFTCSDIPEQYKTQIINACQNNPDNNVRIMIRSAQDFEDTLNKNAVGDIKPDDSICFNNIEGASDLIGLKPAKNIKEFVKSNWEKFGELAEQLGIFLAAAKISVLFAFSVLMLPGILTSTGWDQEKQILMGGQLFLHSITGKAISSLTNYLEDINQKEVIDLAEGQMTKIAEDIAINVGKEVAIYGAKLTLMFFEAISIVGDFLVVSQMFGMIIDIFDWCNLNNTNSMITQNILDNIKSGIDDQMNMQIGTTVLGQPWDPTKNYCQYDLDVATCSNRYQNCTDDAFIKGQVWGDTTKNKKSDGKKTEISENEFCSILTDKDGEYNKYMNEYLNKLKVNYLGQCIKTTTNDELADILQEYIPQYDWSPLKKVNKDNYPMDLFPKSEDARILSIFLVNQNTYVAQFIKDNFYYFLSFFIVILLIILLV